MEITNGLRDAVIKYKSGDVAAFTDIYNESHKYIYVCVYNVMNGNDNKDDMIQDIMQETYVEVSKHLDSLENVDRFLSWAGTIATRKCYEVIKKSGKYVLLGEDETFDNISDDDNIIPEEIMQNKEKQRLLREIIQNELTEMQKLCVVGFFYNDMKQSEIAKELGIPENTVKSNILRAKNKIKESVIELDVNKGTRLYSVAPFMLLLFTDEVKACMVPKTISTSILSGTAVAEAAMVEGAVVKTATQVAASAIKKKLIVGAVSTLLVTGGTAAIYFAHNAKDTVSEETTGIIAETTSEEATSIVEEETTTEPEEVVELVPIEEINDNIVYVAIKEKKSTYSDDKVESIYNRLYEYDQSFNCITRYDVEINETTGEEKVLLSNNYTYNSYGDWISMTSYSYDVTGEVSNWETTQEYEYDEQGRITKETSYSSDAVQGVIIYEYEEKTVKTIYDNGYYIVYTYDDNENVTHYEYYSAENELRLVVSYEYEYDENGNVAKSYMYIGSTQDNLFLNETVEYEYMKTTVAVLKKGLAVLMPDGTGRYFDSLTEEEKAAYYDYVDKVCMGVKCSSDSAKKTQWIRDNYGDSFNVAGMNFFYNESYNDYLTNVEHKKIHYIVDASTYELGSACYQYSYYKLADYLGYYGADCDEYGNDEAFNYFEILYDDGLIVTHENVVENNENYFRGIGSEEVFKTDKLSYGYKFITPERVPIYIDPNGYIVFKVQYANENDDHTVSMTLSEYYDFVNTYTWTCQTSIHENYGTVFDENGLVDENLYMGTTEYKILLVNSEAPVE